jgi:hypothetical protein
MPAAYPITVICRRCEYTQHQAPFEVSETGTNTGIGLLMLGGCPEAALLQLERTPESAGIPVVCQSYAGFYEVRRACMLRGGIVNSSAESVRWVSKRRCGDALRIAAVLAKESKAPALC